MSIQQLLRKLIAARLGRVLAVIEAAVAPEKFDVVRRTILREFGDRGLVLDLIEVWEHRQAVHGDGMGRYESGKEGRSP